MLNIYAVSADTFTFLLTCSYTWNVFIYAVKMKSHAQLVTTLYIDTRKGLIMHYSSLYYTNP